MTFDSRNGSAVAPQRVEKGQTATEPAAPTKTDRTFEGWHLGEDAFDFATPITADTTLTAKWKFKDGTFTDGYLTIENGVVTGCDTDATGDITIPEDVTGIGDRAFWGCESLTSITIPDSVTSIGYMAFYNCSSLESITIPGSVTSIGRYAFDFCDSLKNVYYGGSESEWEELMQNTGADNEPLKEAEIHYTSTGV